LLFDDLVVAPDDLGQASFCHAGFDVGAVEPFIALNIESVGAAGDGAVGIDRAGTGCRVKQRAGDAMWAVDRQRLDSSADFGDLPRRKCSKALLQQNPFFSTYRLGTFYA
jgi:hypothetical protein